MKMEIFPRKNMGKDCCLTGDFRKRKLVLEAVFLADLSQIWQNQQDLKIFNRTLLIPVLNWFSIF